MSEDPGSEEATFDSAAFEEWVEKTAESKDISRGEVLDQMLSSYWILEELTGMMDEAGQSGPASRFGAETAESKADGPDGDASERGSDGEAETREAADSALEGTDLSELIREFQELRSAILEMPDRHETGRRREPPGQWWDEPRRGPPPRADDRLRRTLDDLQDRFEDLSDELADVRDQHAEDVTQLEADIEETLETLESLESSVEGLVGHSELESLAVSLEQELSRIEETATELEGRVTQLEESRSESARKLADIEDGQAQFEERLEREFDSIENVFQHLLDKTDDLEYRIGAVSDSHQTDIETVEDHIEQREQFATLMREAHRKGVSKAVCDNCEAKVDLGLLDAPRCPECDRTYTGIAEGGWLPFDKPKLETEPIGTASDGLDDGSADPSDLLQSPPDDPPT